MTITVKERTNRGKYQVEVSNAFMEVFVLETASSTFATQIHFKKRGTIFLTITLTQTQLAEFLQQATKKITNPSALYGVLNENVVRLYNMDLHVTKNELRLYIEISNALQFVLCDQKGIVRLIS